MPILVTKRNYVVGIFSELDLAWQGIKIAEGTSEDPVIKERLLISSRNGKVKRNVGVEGVSPKSFCSCTMRSFAKTMMKKSKAIIYNYDGTEHVYTANVFPINEVCSRKKPKENGQ